MSLLQTDGGGNFSFVNSTGGNSFGTIAVSGQSNIVAHQGNDTLTLVAGKMLPGNKCFGSSSNSASSNKILQETLRFTLYEYTAT